MYIFDLVKMVALSKDIKAESKSNLLKTKTLTGKEEFSIALSIPNTTRIQRTKTQI